jgi:excisionase family DNA binding protein
VKQAAKLAKQFEMRKRARNRDAEQRAADRSAKRAALAPLDINQRYAIDEAALYLRCSRAYVYRLIKREELPTIQDGRRTYVPGAAIAERSRVAA